MAENRIAIVGTVDPGALTATTHTTDIIDMQKHLEVGFIILLGTLGSSATVDFTVSASANSNMSSSAVLTSRTITQLTQAGTDSNKQVIVWVRGIEIATINPQYRYIQGTLTVGTATSGAGVVVISTGQRSGASVDHNLASVDQVVD